jgi:hypothetical protein
VTDGLASIIAQLERQKAAIERALAALEDVDGPPAEEPKVNTPATRKGGMTPEGKKRLIKALKKRWAARKAAQQASGDAAPKETPAPRKSNVTPEGRKRLAEAMKRRWAVKRAAASVKKRAGRSKKAA